MEDKIRSALFRAYKEELGSDVIDKRMANKELFLLPIEEEFIPIVNRCIRYHNFFVIDAIHFVTAYKSKPTVFLHADNHFSAKIVKEKMKTLDIREKEALKDLKKLMEDD